MFVFTNFNELSLGPTISFVSSTNFLVGAPVYYNGTNYVLANGSSETTNAQFVICKKITIAVGSYKYYAIANGKISLSDSDWRLVNNDTSLVPGSKYFVSSVNGIYSTTPVDSINISMPILVAVSTTEVFVYTNTFSQRVRSSVLISPLNTVVSITGLIPAGITTGVYKFYLKEVPTVGGILRFALQSGSYNSLLTVETSSEWISNTKDTANKLNIYVDTDNVIKFQNKLGSSSPSATNPTFPTSPLNLVIVSDI